MQSLPPPHHQGNHLSAELPGIHRYLNKTLVWNYCLLLIRERKRREKKELVAGLGVYITLRMLTSIDMNSKPTPTGLMRGLVSVWYSSQRLACSCATDINPNIRTAIYSELTMWRVLLSCNCNYY